MTRLQRAAQRLADGSALVTRRTWDRACTWCTRGRREDLTGWRALLGVLVRVALLVLGVYVLARIVRAVPALMWLLTSWWTVAAWRAGRTPSPEAVDEAPTEAPAVPDMEADVEAVRRLLLDVMGTGSAVHLRTVLAHLQKHDQWEGRTVNDLRVHLERLDIPVDRGVKVGRTPTWGVRRRDLEAPSPAAAQETSTAPSTAA